METTKDSFIPSKSVLKEGFQLAFYML